ncbi:MAG TPA: hypothetical protein PKL04_06960 [Methanofastidiosum sp.]|nr:hypothetical protein [Methanofastidiosum sp.]
MNDNLKVVFGFALNYMYKVSPESFTERSDVKKIDLVVKEYNRLNNNESN